jgi:hypothetical protein
MRWPMQRGQRCAAQRDGDGQAGADALSRRDKVKRKARGEGGRVGPAPGGECWEKTDRAEKGFGGLRGSQPVWNRKISDFLIYFL